MNKKRRRREWKEILETLRKSEKSKAAFCKENNIPLSRLQYHMLKSKKGNKNSNLVKVPFSIERSETPVLQIKTDYCMIEFTGHIEEETLKGLLRSLKAVSV